MGKKKKTRKARVLQKKRKDRKQSASKSPKQRNYTDIELEALQAIVAKTQNETLGENDRQVLENLVDTFSFISSELRNKSITIDRLRRLLFGSPTEKTSNVIKNDDSSTKEGKSGKAPKKTPPKGHGRNSVEDYTGAQRVSVPHGNLEKGQLCPECNKGKLYLVKEPCSIVRVSGMAPLTATVYELERLRCNLCGHLFTASPPEGVGTTKYDESAASMMALLKYGCGLPFNRLERLEKNLGIPLPASTQWDVLNAAAGRVKKIYEELIRQAAQGKVLYNDDTAIRVLNLKVESPKGKGSGYKKANTSSIISTNEENQIALFFTGKLHAGQNLAAVLEQRSAELKPPIQMSDCLDVNTAGEFQSLVSHCLVHARRKFVECEPYFPEECEYVLTAFHDIYENEAETKNLSAEERLEYHNKHTKKILTDLKGWMEQQFSQKLVEPNSALGDSIKYMLKRWETFTVFLNEPGAPLDNNICERAIKKAILHRKNSLFYKNSNGAFVGDLFMSIIHTAELCKVNPFEYLQSILRNCPKARTEPEKWMPWNYTENF